MSKGRTTMFVWITASLLGGAAVAFAIPAIESALSSASYAVRFGAVLGGVAGIFLALSYAVLRAAACDIRAIAWRHQPDQFDASTSASGGLGASAKKAAFPSASLTAPVEELVRSWASVRDGLNTSIQEAQIRHKVSEAEREHVEAILHSLRDAVLVTDSFDELSMANGPAAELLGFDLTAAQHASIDAVLKDDTVRQLIKEVRSSAVAGKERRVEHVIQDEFGQTRAYDVTVACLPEAGADAGGVVTIMRDVTRDKEISQMKNDFVSQASHELRTPLASIRAYVEMLTEGEANDEASRQEFYGIIRTETDRVARMVDNMLNISRIEAGIVKAEFTDVDFAVVSREVVEMMTLQAQEKSIKLAVKSGPLVYNAAADRDMMIQVIMNLVSNGIKYTPEGGRVTVSIDNDDASRSVMVTIADTGLGIPPDALEKVFDKFFRIENYKRVAKGTGLGLNLVRHIVETVHSGSVGVTSEVGMGSKFWFTIPYEQDDNHA